MADIIDIQSKRTSPVITIEDINPDTVLQAAIDKGLETAIVVGTTKDGDLYLASSTGSVVEMHWLVSSAQYELMNIALGD